MEEVTFNQTTAASIQGVTNQWVPNVGHVDSNLMGTTGLQIELEEAVLGEPLSGLIVGTSFLAAHHN